MPDLSRGNDHQKCANPRKQGAAKPPARFHLLIETEVAPARNTALMGLYRSSGAYCTQCEAEGFRCITYFLDRPDVLSVYSVRIEALREDAPVLLSMEQCLDAACSGRIS